jgi:hypothetical protein
MDPRFLSLVATVPASTANLSGGYRTWCQYHPEAGPGVAGAEPAKKAFLS